MELVIALIATGFLAVHATRLLAARLHTDSTFMAWPARLLLGMAIVSCLMNVFLRFLPGVSCAWITLAVLVTAAVVSALTKRAELPKADRYGLICILLLAVLMLGWRLLTQMKLGSMLPVEGTDNADELWYIFSAHWLRGHSLLHPFVNDPAFPLAASAGVNIGLLPRIGAESLLVYFSALSGMGIEQVYPVLFAFAAVFFCFTAVLGFLDEGVRNWRFLPLALLTVAISPVALFIFGNGNFATLWGLVFVGGYYWNMQQAVSAPHDSAQTIASGVFLGALLATYPELLAIAVPASVVLYFHSGFIQCRGWFKPLVRLVLGCVVAAVVAPFAIVEAIKVLATGASAAQGANVIFPDLFTTLSPSNILVTLFAFDTEILQRAGKYAPAIASAVLLFAFLFSPRRVWSASAGLALSCVPVFLMFWLRNYGYGGMKAIEFIALPVATLLGAAAGRCATISRDATHDAPASGATAQRIMFFAHIACVLLAVGIFAAISTERSRQFDIHGHASLLTPDLVDLRNARAVLPPGSVLQVGPELGQVPFLASRWIAYEMHDVPLVFPPELQGGGYIYRLDSNHPQRMESVTHVLRARNTAGSATPGAVFENSSFEIVPLSSLPFTFGQGFHRHEGWGRWMAASGELDLRGHCGRKLSIDVSDRYGPLKGEDAMIVSAGDFSMKYPLSNGRGKLVFSVPEGATQVTLRSAGGGVAPASIGAHDDRVLSYAIKNVELASCGP